MQTTAPSTGGTVDLRVALLAFRQYITAGGRDSLGMPEVLASSPVVCRRAEGGLSRIGVFRGFLAIARVFVGNSVAFWQYFGNG